MQIRPILATLRHHQLTVILLMLQVALTFGIVCNVVFTVVDRIGLSDIDTGVNEAGLSVLNSEIIDANENTDARQRQDLLALRRLRGVISAVAVDSLPLGSDESSYSTCPSMAQFNRFAATRSLDQSGCLQPAVLSGSPGELKTLGLRLVEGRDFVADEFVTGDTVPAAILSRALAEKLFPGKDALGQTFVTGTRKPIRIVGIVDTLVRPRLNALGSDQLTMLWPMLPGTGAVTYLLQSTPSDRQGVLHAAVKKLLQIDSNRILDPDAVRTYSDMREAYFQRDTTMIKLLIASGLGLLFVTALGITGLANFWVQQRTRSIGIRRAIGATRGDILRYFQTENFLIVSFGIVLGMLLAFALNLTLMKFYELPRLPLYYLPIGALLLWLLGQLAVLGPALRAAAVPPVVATRSV